MCDRDAAFASAGPPGAAKIHRATPAVQWPIARHRLPVIHGEAAMKYRHLGRSGFSFPVLSFGAGTFGGKGPLFAAWGNTDVAGARRLVDICLDAGVTMFDTADVYSDGESERVLGGAIKGRRSAVIVSTKAGLPFSEAPNDVGSSRHHL